MVQGVGFRPFVFRLAGELGLAGWVLNDERGVLLEAEGPGDVLDAFLVRLAAEAPPLATVERIATEDVPAVGGAAAGFEIVASSRHGAPAALVSPDTATCGDCLPSCSIRPTAASATRSSTAPTAVRASRSSATCPTTGR